MGVDGTSGDDGCDALLVKKDTVMAYLQQEVGIVSEVVQESRGLSCVLLVKVCKHLSLELQRACLTASSVSGWREQPTTSVPCTRLARQP